MFRDMIQGRAAWLALGLVVGLVAGGIWPQAPLHATATDRYDNFAICTGPLDQGLEGIFFLDALTGDLKGAALNTMAGVFNSFYSYNILKDFELTTESKPQFLLVTGVFESRLRAAKLEPALSVIYVAELKSGKVAAYGIPWSRARERANQRLDQTLVLLDVAQFRGQVVRDQ